jgi:hypothetical protein
MMQMLAAGGMPVLTDGERRADIDNPRGYYEWERIKRLPQEPECIDEAEGKAVKVVSQLLFALPAKRNYQILFVERLLVPRTRTSFIGFSPSSISSHRIAGARSGAFKSLFDRKSFDSVDRVITR